jgi:hypothetical protein
MFLNNLKGRDLMEYLSTVEDNIKMNVKEVGHKGGE